MIEHVTTYTTTLHTLLQVLLHIFSGIPYLLDTFQAFHIYSTRHISGIPYLLDIFQAFHIYSTHFTHYCLLHIFELSSLYTSIHILLRIFHAQMHWQAGRHAHTHARKGHLVKGEEGFGVR